MFARAPLVKQAAAPKVATPAKQSPDYFASKEEGNEGLSRDYSFSVAALRAFANGEEDAGARGDRWSRILPVQAKLAVRAADDPLEKEADRAAAAVMGKTGERTARLSRGKPGIQRKCNCGGTCDNCKEEAEQNTGVVLRKASGPTVVPHMAAPPIVHQVLHTTGTPLDAATRAFMEPRFGRDFSKVRIHTDEQAAQSARRIHARAYTVGSQIVFGAGQFAPASSPGRSLLAHELTHVLQQTGDDDLTRASGIGIRRAITPVAAKETFVQRDTEDEIDDLLYGTVARDIDAHAWTQRNPYAYIRERFEHISDGDEDNVGAAFVELMVSKSKLAQFGWSDEGRKTLDVLYQAIITGSVTDFERAQSEKILEAKQKPVPKNRAAAQKEFEAIAEEKTLIFPVRNTGLFSISVAVFSAKLLPSGKVSVEYDSERVFDDMFKEDLKTLLPWRRVTSEPLILDPDRIVSVRLYDDNERVVPLPALALIDIANQSKRAAVGKGLTAFFLGLTLGAGGLGGGAVRGMAEEIEAGEAAATATALRTLKIARTILWADRVAFGLQALSFVLDEFRDKLPSVVVDALDVSNRMLAYYGKARMTLDGWRFIKSKLSPALSQWRAEVPPEDLSPAAKGMQREMDELVTEINQGESEAGTKAVETINKKHLQVEEGEDGERYVEVGDGHKVVEVPDGHGGVICEYHSSGGPEVICPIVLATHEEAPAQPAKKDSKTADPEDKPAQRKVVTQPPKQAPVVAPPIGTRSGPITLEEERLRSVFGKKLIVGVDAKVGLSGDNPVTDDMGGAEFAKLDANRDAALGKRRASQLPDVQNPKFAGAKSGSQPSKGFVVEPAPGEHSVEVLAGNTRAPVKGSNVSHAERQFIEWFRTRSPKWLARVNSVDVKVFGRDICVECDADIKALERAYPQVKFEWLRADTGQPLRPPKQQ